MSEPTAADRLRDKVEGLHEIMLKLVEDEKFVTAVNEFYTAHRNVVDQNDMVTYMLSEICKNIFVGAKDLDTGINVEIETLVHTEIMRHVGYFEAAFADQEQ